MTNFKSLVAVSATVAAVALGNNVRAQDDLDDLLNDLEASPETVTTVKVAEAQPVAKADAPAAEAAPAEEAAAEAAPAEEAAAEATPAEEAAAEAAPAEEAAAEAAPAEEAVEPAAEEPVEAEAAAAEVPVAESAEEAAPVAEAAVANEAAPAAPTAAAAAEDGELIAELDATEKIRRQAMDEQASRELADARQAMENKEFLEAVRHFQLAVRYLNDSPKTKELRKECEVGTAEGLYRAALEDWAVGRRDRAKKIMLKAVDLRHPKARRQLEQWVAAERKETAKVTEPELRHLRNDSEYKTKRDANLAHLRRSRQLLGMKNLDQALVECELVLVNDPYNREAIRIRNVIQKKRHTIMMKEREATREGMMADVDAAWRQPYAIDAREVEEIRGATLKDPTAGDPVRQQEQVIIQRMKDMRLPSISFKPPATIIDAVEYFRSASKDFDRPDRPLEQRGFNFVIKTPEALQSTAATAGGASEEGFGMEDESANSGNAASVQGVPLIPMITASDISFYEALKLVCDSVEYKFKVQGPIVMVMHKDMTTEEMVTRSYPVVSAFLDRIGSASSELKEMKSSGWGGASASSSSSANDEDSENQERDWKEFFSLLGVKWPEGSSIMYIKTIGKLRVKNTSENLAELEKALTEMNADPKLVEIEARFVEVCQEDLNSLGFEWILNSDLTLGVGKHLSRALGIKNGKWGEESSQTQTDTSYESYNTSSSINGQSNPQLWGDASSVNTKSSSISSNIKGGSGNSWSRYKGSSGHNIGINSIGGEGSQYTTGNRYLSTLSNHISGESKSTNDQFMRVNAFLGGADLSMILHMLSQRSDTDLLSAPKVLTKPGEEAVIKVVTEYIYPTDYDVQLQSSSSSSGNNNNGSSSAILAIVEPQSFTMREVGVILDVTPTLTDDGNLIDLKLNTQVVDEPTWKNYGMRIPFTGNSSNSSWDWIADTLSIIPTLGAEISQDVLNTISGRIVDSTLNAMDKIGTNDNITYYDAPMEQPFFHVRSIDSSVSVYPGATIVMGGLITEQRKAMDDKIPFLGDLPFIGRLFRSHSEQTSKRNLLIFVTTRLVDVRGREVTLGSSEAKEEQPVVAAPEVTE